MMRSTIAFVLAVVVPFGAATAQCEMEVINSIGGAVLDVEVVGTTAYVATGVRNDDQGAGMMAIDISDPSSPSILGSVALPGASGGIAVSGSVVFVGGGASGLNVIDVSDPTNPTLITTMPMGVYVGDIDILGSYAYAVVGSALMVVDISDPSDPIVLGSWASQFSLRGVAVSGMHAYLPANNSGLQILDISDPTNPVWVAAIATQGRPRDVEVVGSLAYVADGDLQIIDVSDPTNPVLLGRTSSGGAWNIAVSGTYAYGLYDQLYVFDVSDPLRPTTVANLETYVYDNIAVSGSVAYVAAEVAGLAVVDITTPTNPVLLTSFGTLSNANGITIDGSIAYVTDRQTLHLIEVSDPLHPVFLSSLGFPYAHHVAAEGSFAYVIAAGAVLHIIDVSDPFNPQIIGQLPHEVDDVVTAGSLLYVMQDRRLIIYDVSDPFNPIELGSTDVPGWHFTVSGSYAYIVRGGLGVVDVSDPKRPTVVGSVSFPGGTINGGVAIAGTVAYVAAGVYGLATIDVSDPANPVIIQAGSEPGRRKMKHVAVSGPYRYLTWTDEYEPESWVGVADVTDPLNPTRLGAVLISYSGSGLAGGGVAAVDDMCYVADHQAGLQIIELTSCIAELTGFEVVTGTHISGGLEFLGDSDNRFLFTRSGFGSSLLDLHHMEIRIGARKMVQNPSTLDLTIESRISEPAGTAQIRLFNHNTQQFDLVGQYALGNSDAIETISDIDATNYVIEGGATEIELSIKHIVFVPFLAFTFESFVDHVEISLR